MASNKKITDLDEISSITVADDDVLAIVDVSQDKTYKIRKDAFVSAIAGVTSFATSSPLSVNASTGSVVLTLGTVPVSKGGTGGITASEARSNIGLGSIATQNSNSISVTGGSISGVSSVGTTTLSATGTSTLSTVDINGGAIDGTTIGSSIKSTGAFTTLTATGTSTLSTVDINGGAIDNTSIGASSRSTGAFTTLTASSGYTGTVNGNVTGNVTGDVTGNAGTATRLQTARTIAGQSFDGTANISIGPTNLTGVTATATEINKLDGFTGDATDLNYAKSLYDTGVTATEFDKLDGVDGTIWHNGNDLLDLSSSGYVKLPNGLYIMWGSATFTTSGYRTVPFPITFPTAVLQVNVGMINTTYTGSFSPVYMTANSITTSGFDCFFASSISQRTFIAIGY